MRLFIHGVPDTGFMWTPLVRALGLSKGTFVTPTMPCFDGTTPPGFAATASAYRDWAVEILESAAKHGPVDIVGHDWGAPIAALAAAARPDLIRTWCVVNAAPEPTYEWHSLAKTWQTPLVGELFMALGSASKFRSQLVAAGMPQEIAEHESARIDRHMKRAILKLYRSAKNPADLAADFSEIADRGMVMWGADDPFVPVRFGKRFAERWRLPLKVVEGVGHWGICEKPELFAAHLSEHWSNA